MITVGIDVGSTASKAVILSNRDILGFTIVPTGWSPKKAGREALDLVLDLADLRAKEIDRIVGTGYGRIAMDFLDQAVTEITCHALGANYYFPEHSMVIDIGGQDSKVMLVNQQGKVINFLMNDKCAAGTGKFLQVTVNSLGLEIDEVDQLLPDEPANINSMCTVFAESEVISLLAAGVAKEKIVAGLFQSVAKRMSTMAGSLGVTEYITFTGGVANSRMLRDMLAKELKAEVRVSSNPQIIGALGAAIFAQKLK